MPSKFYRSGREFMAKPPPSTLYFWREQIPASGITLFYGPTSSCKSQFQWQLLQAVQEGSQLFGEEVPQGNTMLFMLDMPEDALWTRWNSMGYIPDFPVFFSTSVDVLAPGFSRSLEFKSWREAYDEVQPSIIGLDALGHLHSGSASKDESPDKVYNFFHEQFPSAAKHIAHHDRKVTTEGFFGKERQDDDALGSGHWRDFAVSSSHIYPIDDFRRKLVHSKSQVAELDDPLIFIQHRTGDLELWGRAVQERLRDELQGISTKLKIPIKDHRVLPRFYEGIIAGDIQPYSRYKKLERHLRRLYLGWKTLQEEL